MREFCLHFANFESLDFSPPSRHLKRSLFSLSFPFSLQTHTYIITLVFLFFLVLTLSFEYCLHSLQHWLRKKGREGLAVAVEKMVLEITLLGFVSLILLIFQQYVPNICVEYAEKDVHWTLLNNTDGCPCCLSNTAGITLCAQMYHDCGFNATDKSPYCGCSLGYPESTSYYDPKYDIDPNYPLNEQNNVTQSEPVCMAYSQNELIFAVEQFTSRFQFFTEQLNTTAEDWCALMVQQDAAAAIGQNGTSTLPSSNYTVDNAVVVPSPNGRRLHASHASSFPLESEKIHIIPEIKTFGCEGPFYSATCGEGKHPYISITALNQIHHLVFLMAGFHIITAIIVMIVASLRMRQWKRWQEEKFDIASVERSLSAVHRATMDRSTSHRIDALESDQPATFDAENSNTIIENSSGERNYGDEESLPNGDNTATASKIEVETMIEEQQEDGDGVNKQKMSPQSIGSQRMGNLNNNMNNSERMNSQRVSSSRFTQAGSGAVNAISNAAGTIRRQWVRRNTFVIRRHHKLAETIICIGKALLPNLVSKNEFNMMRQAYVVSKPDLAADYNFVRELQLHLDFDFVHILGASLTMWIIMILMWLLSGLVAWIPSIFLLFAVLALFGINTWLVANVRHKTRGGRPHR